MPILLYFDITLLSRLRELRDASMQSPASANTLKRKQQNASFSNLAETYEVKIDCPVGLDFMDGSITILMVAVFDVRACRG